MSRDGLLGNLRPCRPGRLPGQAGASRPEGCMRVVMQKFARDERGQGLAEYAVLIGLVTLALVAIITPFRVAIINVFTAVTAALTP